MPDAKWYVGWIRSAPASTPAEKFRNLEAAEMMEQLIAEREQLLKDLCTGIICNCCKHADLPMNDPRCESCNGRNKFEWRGIPEPPKGE